MMSHHFLPWKGGVGETYPIPPPIAHLRRIIPRLLNPPNNNVANPTTLCKSSYTARKARSECYTTRKANAVPFGKEGGREGGGRGGSIRGLPT